uniref:Uncharacterized protein n=1 Tax=Rhizophora mucronata TaxID=61149 RepID=A0A2P2PCN2_RHIMU
MACNQRESLTSMLQKWSHFLASWFFLFNSLQNSC